jgi:hypothetical protein
VRQFDRTPSISISWCCRINDHGRARVRRTFWAITSRNCG